MLPPTTVLVEALPEVLASGAVPPGTGVPVVAPTLPWAPTEPLALASGETGAEGAEVLVSAPVVVSAEPLGAVPPGTGVVVSAPPDVVA